MQLRSFCGVGNPFTIAPLPRDARVLDFGCGARVDCYVASIKVGAAGSVIGVDMTPEMVATARETLQSIQTPNVHIKLIDGVHLPEEDETIDIVISNGVINLATNKRNLFREIFRVLKPGGRLQFADIILEKELPPHLAVGVESWTQ